MLKRTRIGNALLALVLAFTLAMPAPALAWAADANVLSAGASDAFQLDAGAQETAMQPQDASADIWDGTIDTSWYNTTDTSFSLGKPAQLAGLAAIVNGTATTAAGAPIAADLFTGKTITLTADMTLNVTAATGTDANQRSWTPIGAMPLTGIDEGVEGAMPRYADGNFFNGTFDGAGHVVKNLYIYDNTAGSYGGVQGFFGNVGGDALIKNFGICGGYVFGRVAAGLVADAHAYSPERVVHIEGCFNSATVVCNGSSTRGGGGIFGGEEQYRAAKYDDTTGEMTFEANYHGGAYIANCYNTGTITRLSTSNASIGGIAGTGSVQIYGCFNYGQVTVPSMYAGALAGNLVGAGYNVGQDTGPYEGTSCVHDSYALSGSVISDDNGTARLYNLIDATHDKGGTGAKDPSVTDADDVKFKDAEWFAGSSACNALSQSYERGEAVYPMLYWQTGGVALDFTMDDPFFPGTKYYQIHSIENQPYTGSPVTPKVHVSYDLRDIDTGTYTNIALHEGSDYLVAYADNTEVGINTAKVTVTGCGRFFNSQSTTFTIVNSDLNDVTILPIEAQWYYGAAVQPNGAEPVVEVYAANGAKLVEGRDYDLTIANNAPAADEASCVATATIAPASGATAFSGTKSIDFTVLRASEGLQQESGAYLISSKADLQYLAKMTSGKSGSSTFANKTFKVTQDIDATSSDTSYMTDRPADPLFSYYRISDAGERSGGFSGVFDGQGHTITLGLTDGGVSFDPAALALMNYTKWQGTALIKDLTIDGTLTSPNGHAAAFLTMAQPGNVTFENCTNAARVEGDAFYYGSASGFVTETALSQDMTFTMKNCTNTGNIVSTGSRAAGFVGALGCKAATFEGCKNTAPVSSGRADGASGIVCVILGLNDRSVEPYSEIAFKDCSNSGAITVTGSGDAGGILAMNQNWVKSISFERCANTGNVVFAGDGCNGAGIAGRSYSPASFTNCYSNAAVTSKSGANYAAGILGYAGYSSYLSAYDKTTDFSFTNVYATGAFTDAATKAGGLIGNIFLHTKVTYKNTYFDTASASKAIGWNPVDDYPNAVAPPAITGQAVAMDASTMKTTTFATMLKSAFSADGAVADPVGGTNANGGFPVLREGAAPGDELTVYAAESDIASGGGLDYTGADIALSDLVVTGSDNKTLAEGADYVVFYTADGAKGRAIVEGIGNYSGSREVQFTINACDLEDCVISQAKSVNYTDIAGGKATQDVTVTNPAGLPMAEGVDYEVTYTRNTSAGVAYMRVEGKAPYYTGSAMRLFAIEKGDMSTIDVQNVDAHYPLASNSDGLYIYEQLYANNGNRLERSDSKADKKDYIRLFYSFNEQTGKYDTMVTEANGAASNHVSKAGKYQVEFRGDGMETDGVTNWTNGNWAESAFAKFTYGNRLEEDATVSGVGAVYGFSGSALNIAPAVVSELTGDPLEAGVDYDVKYYDAKGAEVSEIKFHGKYEVAVIGKNTWFGEVRMPLEVVSSQYFINDDTVVEGIASSYLYTGKDIAPVPTAVKVGNKTLEPYEYTVSYEDANGIAVASPNAAGAYYVVVAGMSASGYEGAKKVPFSIEEPWVTVYVKQADNGNATVAKSFTKDEFVALKSKSGAAVSALYCDTSGSNWSVASTNNYVTLDDLLAAANVKWGAGAKVSYGGDDPSQPDKVARTYTYEQTRQFMFYPSTTATATDSFGGKSAPFVLSITDKSSRVGARNNGATAYDAEANNLASANGENAPRVIMGVLPSDYGNAQANASSMMGVRLWNKTRAITVTLASADVVPAPAATGVNMYRLYNPYTGEHFYTSSAAERNSLAVAGWNYEGTAWKAPSKSNTRVYRVYNPYSGDHHYTTEASERDSLVSVGWRDEGIGWYSDDDKGVPMYRLYNPYAVTGAHHYTSSAAERDSLISLGWRGEGVGWHGLK